MEPSVGKGFKCSQCPPSDIMRGCMVVFGVRIIAGFLLNLLVSFILFGAR